MTNSVKKVRNLISIIDSYCFDGRLMRANRAIEILQ